MQNVDKSNLREEISLNGLRWINIAYPSDEDIKYLGKSFKFHHLDLEDCLTENQRAKIDEYPTYLFIILHLPVPNRKTKRIMPHELDIFISNNLLITVHENNPIVNKIFDACQKNTKYKEDFMKSGSGFLLYKLLNDLFDSVFPIVDDLTRNISEVEADVFESDNQRDKLKDILLLKKDLINCRRIIMPERPLIAQLEIKAAKFSSDNMEIYFDNVVDKIERIYGVLENLKELVDSLHSTNETIISHNTNNIIKVLTIFSVIMLPLTVVTGFYGMNVTLPFQDQPHSDLIVGGIMLGIVIAMLIYFKVRKWI